MSDCIFCKIAEGEIPSDFVYRDDKVVAFRDVNPQAPAHILVIPRQHITSSAKVENPEIWSILLDRAVKIAKELGFDENGYRMVINTGEHGGQTVPHLHLHLLAGRNLGWPPG